MLDQAEKVRQGTRSRNFLVGSHVSCRRSSGRTAAAKIHPHDLFESRTYRSSCMNSSHNYYYTGVSFPDFCRLFPFGDASWCGTTLSLVPRPSQRSDPIHVHVSEDALVIVGKVMRSRFTADVRADAHVCSMLGLGVKRLRLPTFAVSSSRGAWAHSASSDKGEVKPFREMPGPRPLPILGNFLEVKRNLPRLAMYYHQCLKEFGRIFKLQLPGGENQ